MLRRKSAILISDRQVKDTVQKTTSNLALPRKQKLFDVSAKSIMKEKNDIFSHCAHTSSDLCNKYSMLPKYWMKTNIHIYLELILIHPDNWPGLSLRL